MLPKIISNIILAGIAIFIIYTIAPLIKEYLLVFFGAPKKKNYSQDEFEELVKRKAQMLGVTTRQAASNLEEKQSVRTEFDYLVENNYFLDDEQKSLFQELKQELSWGQGQFINKLKDTILKYHLVVIDDKSLVSLLKANTTKAGLINLFPQKGINIEDYLELLVTKYLCDNINNNEFVNRTCKYFLCTTVEFKILLATTIKIEQKQDWIYILDEYIEDSISDKIDINITKNIKISELIKLLKKNIDIVTPLTLLNEDKLKEELKTKEKDSDFIKKKHKKLLSLYHPDKWIYNEKSNSIDKRLRENFEKVQLIFKNI